MVSIGIDPSINSTGVCVITYENDVIQTEYYIITNHLTKATSTFTEKHENIHVISYNKETNEKRDDYTTKEMKKYYNFKTICRHVSEILKKHNPDFVTMEGISYGSVGSAALVDLSGLNFMLRNTISNNCNAEITIVSPTENKRFAVGCGSINKIAIVDTWSRCEKFTVNKSAKVDDIADAFFMALYRAVDDESFNDKFVLPTIEITEEHKVKRKKKELDPEVSEAFYNI